MGKTQEKGRHKIQNIPKGKPWGKPNNINMANSQLMLDNSAALIFNNSNFKVWHLCLKQQLYKKETNGKLVGQNPQKEKKNLGFWLTIVSHVPTVQRSC